MHDNLLRIFGGDRWAAMMQRFVSEKGVALESRMLSRTIENSQRKVEAYNFDMRKQLLEYDDVANEQRKVIYSQRDELLTADSIAETIRNVGTLVMDQTTDIFIPPHSMEEEWDVPGLEDRLNNDFNLKLPLQEWLASEETLDEDALRARIKSAFADLYAAKEAQMGADIMRQFEKAIMLQTLDTSWREHLAAMDYLRQGIHLRGYAQKNPKQEYKRESFEMFSQLIDKVNYEVISSLAKFEVKMESDIERMQEQQRHTLDAQRVQYQHASAPQPALAEAESEELVQSRPAGVVTPMTRETPKVGRNDSCPCGSGKKYKFCHGKLA
jgi:preprotein translocase subunit SecA